MLFLSWFVFVCLVVLSVRRVSLVYRSVPPACVLSRGLLDLWGLPINVCLPVSFCAYLPVSLYMSVDSFFFAVATVQIGPQLVSLKLTGARIIRDDTFRDMVCTFESMRYLSLDGTFYVKSQAINALAKAGQQLQEVWSMSLCLCW